ncbi:MAG: hypothetical protein ACOYLQ_14595 [Hyphomicrobiaceae bacterium]
MPIPEERISHSNWFAPFWLALVLALAPQTLLAQQAPSDPLRFTSGPWDVKFGFDGGIQIAGEWGSWWNLASSVAPTANYKPDRGWSELWAKPSLRVTYSASEHLALYGGVAAMGTRTLGHDVFEEGDTGHVSLENGYAGIRIKTADGLSLDLSGGQQDYSIGNGMLIQTGAGNGFERGALLFAPRTAWGMTGVARLSLASVSFDAFYLDPNELSSSDTKTRLAGAKTEVRLAPNQMAGLAYIDVLSSEYPSMQAPLTLVPNGRDGLQTIHGYVRVEPLPSVPGLWIAGDLAQQWNDRIDLRAVGGQGEVGYTAAKLPFSPTFSYAYRYFSGDDPATGRNERFDPLFYAGSPTLWATGGNGSLAFYNSNVQAHRLGVDLVLTQSDLLKFRYWRVDAAELNSPIQFGQATRLGFSGSLPVLLVGVQKPQLSDHFYVEYTKLLTQNLFLTSGVALSAPGAGLKEIAPGSTENWWGAYTAFIWKY